MIEFVEVSGPCRVEDGNQSQQAEPGLQINNHSEQTIVATAEGARAKFTVNGNLVDLPASSYIVVHPRGARPYKHRSKSKNFKVQVGRIWSTVSEVFGGRANGEIVEGGNAVAGVRG